MLRRRIAAVIAAAVMTVGAFALPASAVSNDETAALQGYAGQTEEAVSAGEGKSDIAAAVKGSARLVSADYTSAVINYSAVQGAVSYTVTDTTQNKLLATFGADSAGRDQRVNGLLPCSGAYLAVQAVKSDGGTQSVGMVYVRTKQLAAVKNVQIIDRTSNTTEYTTAKLSWSAVEGAQGYSVYQKKNGVEYFLKKTAKTEDTLYSLKAGSDIEFVVKAYIQADGKLYYGDSSQSDIIRCRPQTPEASLTVSGNSVKISYNATTGAEGYMIYRSTSSNGTFDRIAINKGKDATSYTDSGLASGTTYYYKVRAYRSVGDSKYYSSYSGVISAAVPLVAEIDTLSADATYSTVTLKWSRVSEAAGYIVYRFDENEWKKLATITSGSTLSWTDKQLKPNTVYKYRVKAYKTIDGKTYTGDSREVSVKTKNDDIDAVLSEMSLHEKVCQMFIITPEQLMGATLVTSAGSSAKSALEKYPVGGMIYFAQNLTSVSQTKKLTSDLQGYAAGINNIPLFISVDEEGGNVARCAQKLGTTKFLPMYEYRSKGTQTAYDNANTIARDIAALGFNLDFAPVADTWSNSANTVIGKRAYSSDFSQAAQLVGSAVKGFNDGGVSCTLKHFPGHGDTAEDSHYNSAYVNKTLAQLEAQEYLPFKSGIEAGADMVMIGHIIVTKVENIPATISPTIINGELRKKLGFDGVVISDSMQMAAVADRYSSAELAVRFVQAGGDIILCPKSLEQAVSALENAVKNGTISEDRIDQSVRRILELKIKRIGLN